MWARIHIDVRAAYSDPEINHTGMIQTKVTDFFQPEAILEPSVSRYVLFPIQYHEVTFFRFILTAQTTLTTMLVEFAMRYRYGQCTNKQKHPFGPQKR